MGILIALLALIIALIVVNVVTRIEMNYMHEHYEQEVERIKCECISILSSKECTDDDIKHDNGYNVPSAERRDDGWFVFEIEQKQNKENEK